MLIGQQLTRGLKAGDPQVGRAIAEGEAERLAELCADVDVVLLVAGLGGSTGSGVAPALARVARESGALVLSLATLPFALEGHRRAEQAAASHRLLRVASDATILLPNEKVVKLLAADASFTQALDKVDEVLAHGLSGLCRLISRPGMIKVDFADLCEVVRGRQAESFLASAEASGERRVHQVMRSLMDSPFLDQGEALAEAETVLVSIAGGPTLSYAEVDQFMSQLNRQCRKAQVVMGAEMDPELGNHLLVTLVGTLPSRAPDPVVHETESDELAGNAPDFGAPDDSSSRAREFTAPAPRLAEAEKAELYASRTSTQRQPKTKPRGPDQTWLPLEVHAKGRFESSEPTRYRGEDLDTPTYIRKGVRLN